MALKISSKLGFQSQVLNNILFSSSFSAFNFHSYYYYYYGSFKLLSSQATPISEKPGLNQINVDGFDSINISNFLVKTLELSQSQLSSVMKNHSQLFRPTKNQLMRVQDAVQLFRGYGFTDAQIRSMIVKCPSIFTLRANENLRPKLELMKSIGFSNNDLGHTLSRGPRVLCRKDLHKVVDRCLFLFHGDVNLCKAVKRYPRLLGSNLDKADQQIRFLGQCGIPQDRVFNIICQAPSILSRSTEATHLRVKYFRNLGVSENSKTFTDVMVKSMSVSLGKMDEKLEMLGTVGFSQEEVKEMVRKHPVVLLWSCDKIKRTTEYLMHNGILPSAIVKRPSVMGLSLETRIKPRLEVYKVISGSSQSKRFPSILTFLSTTEKLFLEKYVINNPDRNKLFDILGHHNKGSTKAD